MNLPNKITIFRILLVFVFMPCLFLKGLTPKIAALLMFLIAVTSDYFDGFFARKYNMVSDFGKIMDPIADKVLVLAAFIAFVELKLVPAWMVVLIILREMLVTSLRLIALRKDEVIAASMAGKHKTASQMFSIFIILIFMIIKEAGAEYSFNFWNSSFEYWYQQLIFITMIITLVLTILSGISYVFNNKKLLFPDE